MDQATAEARGAQGEARVNELLGELGPELGFGYAADLLFDFNGKTTQIDHVVVDEYGILVIETKTYGALLKGTSDDRQWTACYRNGKTGQMQNPLRQNDTHRVILGKLLTQYGRELREDYIQSVVVFASGATRELELSGIDRMRVVELDGLKEYLRSRKDFQFAPHALAYDTQADLFQFIQSQNRRQDPEVWARHIEYAKACKEGRRAKGQRRGYGRRPQPSRPDEDARAIRMFWRGLVGIAVMALLIQALLGSLLGSH